MDHFIKILALNLLFLQFSIAQGQADNQYHGTMQIESSLAGKDRFKFAAKLAGGKTQPDICRVCAITPPNESKLCCDSVTTHTKAENCNGFEFSELKPATKYQMNMCYSNTDNNILTIKFNTKNIPITKKVEYDKETGIMKYTAKYRNPEEIPTNCYLKYADDRVLTCIENEKCGCESGSLKIESDHINYEYRLVDDFGGWLFVFTPTGPKNTDPQMYTFQLGPAGINSLPYTISSTLEDINDNTKCKFVNTEDSTNLKCTVGQTNTEECTCKGGTLVELAPSTVYNVDIKIGDQTIIEGTILKTARVGERIEHIIGLKSYKYMIKYRKEDTIGVDNCRACVIKQENDKKCCYKEHYYTNANHCTERLFNAAEIKQVEGTEFKINVCDLGGNQIISDNFSMPRDIVSTKYTVTTSGILYELTFQDDKAPTYCKFKIRAEANSEPMDSRCLNKVDCVCSSGLISYPVELNAEATLIITDYFGEEIKSEQINLQTRDSNTMKPAACPGATTTTTATNLPTDRPGGTSGTSTTNPGMPDPGTPTTGGGSSTDTPTGGGSNTGSTGGTNTGTTKPTTATGPTSAGGGNTGTGIKPPTTSGGTSGSGTTPPKTGGGTTGSGTIPPKTGGGTTGTGTVPPTTNGGNTGPGTTTGGGTVKTGDGDVSDNGESDNQGLSGGAIAGIIVGVLVLVGSAGGAAYYVTQVRGKNSIE